MLKHSIPSNSLFLSGTCSHRRISTIYMFYMRTKVSIEPYLSRIDHINESHVMRTVGTRVRGGEGRAPRSIKAAAKSSSNLTFLPKVTLTFMGRNFPTYLDNPTSVLHFIQSSSLLSSLACRAETSVLPLCCVLGR